MICKNADLFAQLDQKYVDKIIRKKIRYIRHCPDGASSDYLSWQKVLHSTTREVSKFIICFYHCLIGPKVIFILVLFLVKFISYISRLALLRFLNLHRTLYSRFLKMKPSMENSRKKSSLALLSNSFTVDVLCFLL